MNLLVSVALHVVQIWRVGNSKPEIALKHEGGRVTCLDFCGAQHSLPTSCTVATQQSRICCTIRQGSGSTIFVPHFFGYGWLRVLLDSIFPPS